MKNQKHTNTQTANWDYNHTRYLPNNYGRIGAILLGAGVISSIGAIAAPIAIETVFVGDTDNAADTLAMTWDGSSGYGAVNYGYQIGKYEVTTTQYAAFLNAVASTNDTYGLYNANMANPTGQWVWGCGIVRNGDAETGFTYSVMEGHENFPVNHVSFWDAARFCNWLTTNGTDTETGMYNLTNSDAITNNTVARNDTAWNNGGVAIASEDEWYKAAYYDPNKNGPGSGNYWLYPTKSDTAPFTDDANYGNYGGLVAVGNFDRNPNAASYYGTFQQGGNVWEWNDTVMVNSPQHRGVRGGVFFLDADSLAASARVTKAPSHEDFDFGFRVTSLAPIVVPESQTYALFGGMALLGLTLLRHRNKK